MTSLSNAFVIQTCIAEFHKHKATADAAIGQLDDAQLHARINPLQNSVAAIMQHMAGNMISRWTDFLTADGEKPDRDREAEFADRQLPRKELLALWESGWKAMFDALAPMTDADLQRTIYIRKEPHTVTAAILRQMSHYATHIGQILLIGKHLRGDAWKYLTIPPGGTKAFNAAKGV
jgi:hypothetical protein